MTDQSLFISTQLKIPTSEISYRYSRSGGPGGQHVNTSATQVELLWEVGASPSLSNAQRAMLVDKLASRIDSEGVLHLRSSETRSQERNRQAVTERFVALLQKALKPRRKRIVTAVPKAVKERRLQAKKRRSEKKQRRRVNPDE